MQAPTARKTLPIYALILGCALVLLCGAPGETLAQDSAWSSYEDAVDASERGEYDQALLLYRQAERVVTDPVLARAVCYGSGVVARKLVERRTVDRRSLACQGVAWFDCYLDDGDFEDPEVERISRRARAQLQAICEPVASVEAFNPWPMAGVAAGSLAVGAVFFGLAIGDADEIRRQKQANDVLGGESPAQASALETDEKNARLKHGMGLGLIGAGVSVASWVLWRWSTETKTETGQSMLIQPGAIGVQW
jgi:hypothetical protein